MKKTRESIAEPVQQRQIFSRRALVLAIIVLIAAAVITYRMIELKVIDHHYYVSAARNNRIQIDPVAPPRGLIYSRNGQLLAENIPGYNLLVIPDEVRDFKKTLTSLVRLLQISSDQLRYFRYQLEASPAYRAVPLITDLTQKQLATFAVQAYRFPGILIQAHLMRHYPFKKLTVNSVGYVGRINIPELHHINADNYAGTDYFGKQGLELEYQSLLHGKVGDKVVEVNAVGHPLRVIKEHLPVPGKSLILTLDMGLQRVAEQAMKGWRGAVVVLDPRTGAILALVSKPAFDPNWFINGISEKHYQSLLGNPGKPLWNRAVNASYAPGSTIKPFIALAALDAEVITPQEKIYSGPYYIIPGTQHKFWDWDQWGQGWTNLKKAIEESVDTYFYPVASRLGIKKMDQTLDKFGFGKNPLPGFPGVSSGLLPTPQWKRRVEGYSWYPGDTVIMGIGQGFLQVSPLQLAKAVSIIAMRGHGFHPQLVRAIYDPVTGQLILRQPQPLPVVKMSNPRYWQDVIIGMHAVTASPHGTAHTTFIGFPLPVAGKTGTAQIFSIHGNPFAQHRKIPYDLRDNALFEAFTPIKHPHLTVVVICEHAGDKIGPASAVTRKIMDYWYAHQNRIDNPLSNPRFAQFMSRQVMERKPHGIRVAAKLVGSS